MKAEHPESSPLPRSLTLGGAVALNLLDMIGVGPFLTLPLLLAAMGGPQAMLGWVLGALLAMCDGLVWAELGAAMPEAGGSYAYLQRLYPGRWGRWLSFLFVFQLCLSAPLSIASGSIGLAQYAGFVWPSLRSTTGASVHFGRDTVLAAAVVLVAMALGMRKAGRLRGLSMGLLAVVLLTIAAAIATGVLRGHAANAVAFPTGAWRLDRGFFLGLGSAMLIATYDYWGYYNVAFLGGEVRAPERTIPRALLGSIAIVAVLYLLLNVSMLSVLGTPPAMVATASVEARQALLSEFMRVAWTPVLGASRAMLAGRVAAVAVMLAAFGSVFALLIGYARIPFAAARDGNFPRIFAKLDRKGTFPAVSMMVLAVVACACCAFSLPAVIAALVVLRILLQFSLQHVGLLLWRRREPDAARPFRVWLYPWPPLLAILGFGYIVFSRVHSGAQIALAAAVGAMGTLVLAVREAVRKRTLHPHEQRENEP